MKNYTIAVAGTGYVGLSIATLLAQHHKVIAVDVIPESGTHSFREHYTFSQQQLSPSQRDHLRELYTSLHSTNI